MGIATDCILLDLGRHCPKLVELSLKGSGKVGDESVGDIATCSKLRILDIQGTQITGNGLLEIIGKCPQLSWVEHCPFNCDSDFKIFRSRKEMLDLIQKGYMELQARNSQERETDDVPSSDMVENRYNIKNFWL